MTPEKLASQVAHVTLNLGYREGYYEGYANVDEFDSKDQIIIVLGLSHKKFNEHLAKLKDTPYVQYHVQTDLGLTEVEAGTITAFGFIS